MDLGQKEFRLNDAGFSHQEIADWKKQKIQKLNNAGFNNQEILEAFGTTNNNNKIYQEYFSDIKKQIIDEYESQEIVSPDDEMLYQSRIEQGDPVSLKEVVVDFQILVFLNICKCILNVEGDLHPATAPPRG